MLGHRLRRWANIILTKTLQALNHKYNHEFLQDVEISILLIWQICKKMPRYEVIFIFNDTPQSRLDKMQTWYKLRFTEDVIYKSLCI